jgi:hypothetical protein
MKQSCVSAFARGARTFALAAVALAAGAGSLLAQAATGKVEGRVRDQQGAPIANAQVVIVGTRFGAQTNADGYYFMNNVPASTLSVRASFIGYKTTQVAEVRVLGDQTVTVDVTLEATPFQVEDITIIAAETPLVPRDEVTTKQRTSGDYADKLPVDRITNVLALQPGVVASTSGGTLSIRGGRPDETGLVVDGVPVGAGNRGTGFVWMTQAADAGNVITVGTNAFEEVSVTTGASSAEFGGSQSGVISVATRTGGSQFSGALGYESDELFGTASSLGFNRVTASLGGPIVSNLTFFVSGVLEGQKSNGSGLDRSDSPIFVSAVYDGRRAHRVGIRRGHDLRRHHELCRTPEVRRRHSAAGRSIARAPTGIANNYGSSVRVSHPDHDLLGLPVAGQAELFVRDRVAHQLHRAGQPGPGPDLQLCQPVQSPVPRRESGLESSLHS